MNRCRWCQRIKLCVSNLNLWFAHKANTADTWETTESGEISTALKDAFDQKYRFLTNWKIQTPGCNSASICRVAEYFLHVSTIPMRHQHTRFYHRPSRFSMMLSWKRLIICSACGGRAMVKAFSCCSDWTEVLTIMISMYQMKALLAEVGGSLAAMVSLGWMSIWNNGHYAPI